MSWNNDALHLLRAYAMRAGPLRVRALHLPAPLAGWDGTRGEFCALELDDGAVGMSYVVLGDTLAVLRAADPQVAGADALELAAGFGSTDRVRHNLGFAAINALTRSLWRRVGFEPPRDGGSLGGLSPVPGETVGMIGLFPPLVKTLHAAGSQVLALELRPDLVRDEPGLRVTLNPADLAGCREVLATGTLLLNGTLEAMRAACCAAQRFVLLGPSVGVPPDPLFARRITHLGGSQVIDGPGYCDAVRRSERTTPFTRKHVLGQEDYPGWDALLARL